MKLGRLFPNYHASEISRDVFINPFPGFLYSAYRMIVSKTSDPIEITNPMLTRVKFKLRNKTACMIVIPAVMEKRLSQCKPFLLFASTNNPIPKMIALRQSKVKIVELIKKVG